MPRRPRVYSKTIFFHVMIQGINKSYIFNQSEDIKYYIKAMYKLTQTQEVKIIAYCIMSNHAHMLLKTEKIEELSKYMLRLNTKYASYYNRKYDRVGYVFRDRYKAEGIYDNKQLYSCMKYIYNNPVKAGICERAEEYLYSNYKMINEKQISRYVFLDAEEDNLEKCKKAVKSFLEENNIALESLKKDKNQLKKLLILLKDENNISLRKIAKEIDISREKIRRLYKTIKI